MVVEAIDFGVKLFNDTIVLCIHIFKDFLVFFPFLSLLCPISKKQFEGVRFC